MGFILDLLDLLFMVMLIVSKFLPWSWIVIVGIFTLAKGLIFTITRGCFKSKIYILCGIIMILKGVGISHISITTLVCIFLLLRGIRAFM